MKEKGDALQGQDPCPFCDLFCAPVAVDFKRAVTTILRR